MRRFLTVFVLLSALPVTASAQEARPEQKASQQTTIQEAPRSVVARPAALLDTRDVGVELLSGGAALLRARQALARVAPAALAEEEVSTEAFKRGALVGGLAGLAGGALVGALLGGDRNARIETAVPVGLAGLAVGAPTGVYLYTDRAPRYLWGAAGAAVAVAAGTAIYFVER